MSNSKSFFARAMPAGVGTERYPKEQKVVFRYGDKEFVMQDDDCRDAIIAGTLEKRVRDGLGIE